MLFSLFASSSLFEIGFSSRLGFSSLRESSSLRVRDRDLSRRRDRLLARLSLSLGLLVSRLGERERRRSSSRRLRSRDPPRSLLGRSTASEPLRLTRCSFLRSDTFGFSGVRAPSPSIFNPPSLALREIGFRGESLRMGLMADAGAAFLGGGARVVSTSTSC